MTDKTELLALAEQIEAATGEHNALDVRAEVALMQPEHNVRANSAGTKIIYVNPKGHEQTWWASDYTSTAERRTETAAKLRAKAGAA